MIVKLLTEHHLERRLHRLVRVNKCQNATVLEISVLFLQAFFNALSPSGIC